MNITLPPLVLLASLPFAGVAELAGQNWAKLAPTASPSSRFAHAMATDTKRQQVVLFSGSNDQADTWEFDGTTWKPRAPTFSPPKLRHAGMNYDSTRNRTVLFGGLTGTTETNGTFEWDGTNWQAITTTTIPPVRYGHAQVYDSTRKITVVFGGRGGTFYRSDTWTYAGSNWTRLATTGPAGRIYPAMAFDFVRGVCVLFGGFGAANDLSDTWEFDGKSWKKIEPAVAPPARWGHTMTYVLGKGVVLHGGHTSTTTTTHTDTWIYDGLGWSEAKPTTVPSARRSAAMTSDWTFKATLFGGTSGGSETWQFDFGTFASASYATFGKGCGSPGGEPELGVGGGTLPFINERFTIAVTNLPINAALILTVSLTNKKWSGLTLPFDISALGFPGCFLRTGQEILLPLKATGTEATVSATLPNDPTIVGATIYDQAFVFDPNAPGGLSASNGAAAKIGRR